MRKILLTGANGGIGEAVCNVLGDRYEILPVAQIALFRNIPLAHIHGGEITSGVLDEQIRHAVTKFSDIHFVSNQIFKKNNINVKKIEVDCIPHFLVYEFTYENEILSNTKGYKYIGENVTNDEILKPYFTTRKKSGGTGLGLSIVEKILFDHQAEFEIVNRSDGINGAEVKIIFNLDRL